MRTFVVAAVLAATCFGVEIATGGRVVGPGHTESVPECAAAATDRELLVNPGFETGRIEPWLTSNWIVDTIYPHGGRYCASDVGNFWIMQWFDSTPGGEIQSISFWARQPDQPAAQAYDFFYSDGTYDEYVQFPSPDWAHFDVTHNLNRGKNLIGFRIWGYSGGGPGPDSTYIDDVSIQVAGQDRDVGVVELVHPRDTVDFDSTHIPVARVANFGDVADTFPVVMRLEDICDPDPYYYDTVQVMLAPGDTLAVEFTPWRPMYPALHRATCWTVLEGDMNRTNDTLSHFFWVSRITGIAQSAGQRPESRVLPTLAKTFWFPTSGRERMRVEIRSASGALVFQGDVPAQWPTGREGAGVPAGVYFCRLGDAQARLILLK